MNGRSKFRQILNIQTVIGKTKNIEVCNCCNEKSGNNDITASKIYIA